MYSLPLILQGATSRLRQTMVISPMRLHLVIRLSLLPFEDAKARKLLSTMLNLRCLPPLQTMCVLFLESAPVRKIPTIVMTSARLRPKGVMSSALRLDQFLASGPVRAASRIRRTSAFAIKRVYLLPIKNVFPNPGLLPASNPLRLRIITMTASA